MLSCVLLLCSVCNMHVCVVTVPCNTCGVVTELSSKLSNLFGGGDTAKKEGEKTDKV